MGGENVFVRLKPGINRRKLVQELEGMGIRGSADSVADFLINTKSIKATSHIGGGWYRLYGWRYAFNPDIFEEVNPTLEGVEGL